MGAGASKVLPHDHKPKSNPRLTLPQIKFIHQMEPRKMMFMGAISGSPLLIMHALEKGEDPSKPASHTLMTPLHFAARYGNEHCVDLLIKGGAKINVPQKYGWRPIHEAAMNGHPACIEILLDYGAHANAKTGRTIKGMTPLHYAARHGHLDCVKMLVEMGAKVGRYNENHEAPIHVAAMRDQAECLECLLENGANVKARTVQNTDAAYISAMIGSVQCLRVLMKHDIKINAAYHDGFTMSHAAVVGGKEAFLEALLTYGANVELRTYERKMNPLHLAARHGQANCVRLLLKRGASVNALSARRYSALHHAIRRSQKEAAQVLIESGADVNAVTEETNETPLRMCITSKDTRTAALLMKAGADPNIPDINNRTPLHLADNEMKKILAPIPTES